MISTQQQLLSDDSGSNQLQNNRHSGLNLNSQQGHQSSKKKIIVIGNWKSNFKKENSEEFIKNIVNKINFDENQVEVVIAPVFVHIPNILQSLNKNIKIAAQNCSQFGLGAYTGEVSAEHLKDLGVNWVILGHSERRMYFGENDKIIKQKAQNALKNNLKVVACVGENLQQRQNMETLSVCQKFLEELIQIEGNQENWSDIVIGYEPVWAIGTGKVAQAEEIEEVHNFIRNFLSKYLGETQANQVRIVYGGSVNAENSSNLLKIINVDGFLVGGASLKPEFSQIVQNCSEFQQQKNKVFYTQGKEILPNKIPMLFVYSKNKYDILVDKAIEVASKYKDQVEINVLQKDKKYDELLKNKDQTFKNSIEILVINNFNKKILPVVIPHYKNIKWVQALGTGVENLLEYTDFKANNNIMLTNLKTQSNTLLAEFAMQGCLYFSKEIKMFENMMKTQSSLPKDFFHIQELYNKRVLIVGLGSIGQEVARKCKYGFNMRVTGIKRDVNKNIDSFKDYVEKVNTLDNLKQEILEADFVINCLPQLKELGVIYTKDIIDSFKKNCVFVNIGRGSVVDESYLFQALKLNQFKGAALDVVSVEPISKDSPIYTDKELQKKLLYTFHAQDSGPFNFDKSSELFEVNLNKYLKKQQLNGIINKQLGY